MHLLGRTLSGLSDLVTVFLVLPHRAAPLRPPGGAAGGALLSVCVLHIQQAHFFVFDSYLVTLITASFYFCVDIAETGRWRVVALAGLFLGLALATKLSMVVFAPVLALAGALDLWKCTRRAGRRRRAPGRTAVRRPPAGAVGRRPGEPDGRRGPAWRR